LQRVCKFANILVYLSVEVSLRLNHTNAVRHVTRSGDQSRRRQRNNVVDRSVGSSDCISPLQCHQHYNNNIIIIFVILGPSSRRPEYASAQTVRHFVFVPYYREGCTDKQIPSISIRHRCAIPLYEKMNLVLKIQRRRRPS